MKIDLYDTCTCGSGKKFKFCCKKEEEKPKPPINLPTFPEKFVIGELIQNSREFSNYYNGERHKIKHPIYWAEDPKLSVIADCTRFFKHWMVVEFSLIRLRQLPASIDEATTVAHELHHLVLDHEGYKSMVGKKRFEVIASQISSMILDPILLEKLASYNLDIKSVYIEENRELLKGLKKYNKAPVDELNRLIWITNYVSSILDWEVVSKVQGYVENELKDWFETHFPKIASEGQELISFIKNIGFDTPEKQNTLMNQLAERCDPNKEFLMY